MIQSSKMSKHGGSAVVNIIIIVSIFSVVVEILCALGVDVNTLNIRDGRFFSMDVREGRMSTNACGDLGCLEVPNITFLIGDEAKDYISVPRDNQTVNYKETITLSCPPVNPNDSMIYWLSTRSFQANLKNFSFDNGKFQLMNTSLKRYELTLPNVSGYCQRWYICILNKKNITAITWQYLTVKGDPNNRSYWEEPLEMSEIRSPTAGSGTSVLNSPWSDAAPGVIASGVLILVALITIITIVIIRKRRKNVIVKYWMKKIIVKKPEIDYTSPGSGDLVMPIVKIERQKLTQVGVVGNDTTLMSEYQLPVDSTWEILRSNMTFSGQVLGQGEFGKVVKAECNGIISEGVKTVVAVKMLKDGHSDADMIALVSEMEIMKLIGKHENIINLLGCCTQDGPLYVVVEYARNGCLREFLKKHKPDKNPAENLMKERFTQGDLIDFALQVAKGMEYLTSRGCIHRDLAARNVLVSGARVLKVADFGLARDVRDSDYYRKRSAGRLPIKWMAPESIIQNMYTKRSDVWSFGVLSWEIMTFGSTPYPNVPVQYLYQWLKQGHRLEKPKGCSDEIYKYMTHCWTFEPEGRPTFLELVQTLKTMSQIKDAVSSDSTMLPSYQCCNCNVIVEAI